MDTETVKANFEKVRELEGQLYKTKHSMNGFMSEIVTRFLIAFNNKEPGAFHFHNTNPERYYLDPEEWDIDTFSGTIDIDVPNAFHKHEFEIPLDYFYDEGALQKFEEECMQVRKDREERVRLRQEEKERAEYERLKERFEE